jgi:hypothetical protein
MYINPHENYNLFNKGLAFFAIKYKKFRNLGTVDKETNLSQLGRQLRKSHPYSLQV